MIEVDVFWSFAIGGTFASASAPLLLAERSVWINRYFIYNLLFLSLLFAPSGTYLLWQHTGWETMFVLDRSMHGVLPMLFTLTNVSQGVLGFLAVRWCIAAGRNFLATFLWTVNYDIMFGILGFGYARFLHSGREYHWPLAANEEYPSYAAFISSDVFFALLAMSVVILPALYIPLLKWSLSALYDKNVSPLGIDYLRRQLANHLISKCVGIVTGVFLYSEYIAMASEAEKQRLTDVRFGYYAPLVGFLVAEVVFGLLVCWPLVVVDQRIRHLEGNRKAK